MVVSKANDTHILEKHLANEMIYEQGCYLKSRYFLEVKEAKELLSYKY
jgi:hypothetical protein